MLLVRIIEPAGLWDYYLTLRDGQSGIAQSLIGLLLCLLHYYSENAQTASGESGDYWV